jgi:rhodanese-related sulfurtransferase
MSMGQNPFASLYAAGDPFAFIDTRERRDYVDGHWFGSTNIPLSVLTARIQHLVPDRDFPVYLLDWQGPASSDATSYASDAAKHCLARLGYSNVTIIQTARPQRYGDGFVRGEYVWSKAFGEVVAHTADLPEVTPAEYIANYKDAVLFDVRPTAEYRAFTLPGSHSLPNSLLLANAAAVRGTSSMVLLHCAGRTRSIIGACTLKAAGYDGPYAIFKGGTQAWQLDGHEREYNADRIFATNSEASGVVEAFLNRWQIPCHHIADKNLAPFIAAHRGALLFDVSNDAATGQRLNHDIVKISGTNLIQQTDRSIARYHVPVVLFDHGSGSRAAFAAYWLRCMGFDVQVVYRESALGVMTNPHEPVPIDAGAGGGQTSADMRLDADQLLACHGQAVKLFDFRPSGSYRQGHLAASEWQNISTILTLKPASEPLVIICETIDDGMGIADLLAGKGWHIKGIFCWDDTGFETSTLARGGAEMPIDESALFAGRHHGVLQDARDYLAWEEDLPDQIDPSISQMWTRFLRQTPATK